MDKMKNNCSDAVREILDNYLEQNNYRKTPERFAILDAVYSFNSYFSIQELSDRLIERCFPVSYALQYGKAVDEFTTCYISETAGRYTL